MNAANAEQVYTDTKTIILLPKTAQEEKLR